MNILQLVKMKSGELKSGINIDYYFEISLVPGSTLPNGQEVYELYIEEIDSKFHMFYKSTLSNLEKEIKNYDFYIEEKK